MQVSTQSNVLQTHYTHYADTNTAYKISGVILCSYGFAKSYRGARFGRHRSVQWEFARSGRVAPDGNIQVIHRV